MEENQENNQSQPDNGNEEKKPGRRLRKIFSILSGLKESIRGSDWFFVVFVSFAAFKDFFDLLLAYSPPLQFIMSFILDILFISLAVVFLILVSDGGFINFAKNIGAITTTSVAEFIPGLNWLPTAIAGAIGLYLLVLSQRGGLQKNGSGSSESEGDALPSEN